MKSVGPERSDPPHRRHDFPPGDAPATPSPHRFDTLEATTTPSVELDLPFGTTDGLVDEAIRVSHGTTVYASGPLTSSPTSEPSTCGPTAQPRSSRVYSHHCPSVLKGISVRLDFLGNGVLDDHQGALVLVPVVGRRFTVDAEEQRALGESLANVVGHDPLVTDGGGQ